MLNGWFTIFAQVVNFLILVWLLKRFLYRPILNAIDERERGIASQLALAEAKVADAQKERDTFRAKNEAFDQQRADLLTAAHSEAGIERERLIAEARNDADALRAKRQASLRTEQKNLDHEIVRWTQKEVFSIARKALKDLADTSLEERMTDIFVQRLRGLTGEAKQQLVAAFTSPNGTLNVRTAFALSPEQRTAIENAVKETLASDAQLKFETVPEVVSGIELSANGHKVGWSLADYMATLEARAAEILLAETNSAGKESP